LGKDVDVHQDVIIIVGHGNYNTGRVSVKTATKEAGLTLTDKKPSFNGGQIILSVEEVAARLIYVGLRSEHKYIKTPSCCGVGIGEFDPGENKLNVDNILNDKYPLTFARNLARRTSRFVWAGIQDMSIVRLRKRWCRGTCQKTKTMRLRPSG
jgi:hypothetical protein